eukprot:10688116-Lingulodinium_polyedra.AAC.1
MSGLWKGPEEASVRGPTHSCHTSAHWHARRVEHGFMSGLWKGPEEASVCGPMHSCHTCIVREQRGFM